MPSLEYEVELIQHQLDFLNSKKKFTLLSGGYGSAKTYAMIIKSIYYALNYSEIKIIVCAETFPLLRDTVFKEFLAICPKRFLMPVGYTKLPLNVYFRNGSEIYFRSFDKEWKPKSFTVGAIFVEELTTFKADTFKQLRGRLRQTRGKGDPRLDFPRTLGAATNPGSLTHWVYKDFIDLETKMNDCEVIYSKSQDNTYLPDDYLKDLENLKRTNPEYYNRNVLGQWGQLEGLIYDLPAEQRKDPNLEFDYFLAGLDFGFGHPTALSIIGVTSGRYVVVEEWYQRKVTSKDIIQEISKRHNKYGFYKIYCDSARPEIIEEMVQAGLPAGPCIKGAGSVFSGIMYLKGLIGAKDLFVSQEAVYHLREFDSYIWDKSNEIKEQPIKTNDDAMDALRYAIYTYALENGLDVSADELYDFQKAL